MGAEHVCHLPRMVIAVPNVNSWPLMRKHWHCEIKMVNGKNNKNVSFLYILYKRLSLSIVLN